MEDQSDTAAENEWELLKENVQPLKKGRILSNLTIGLQSQQSGVEMSLLREEKQAFEYKLRMYNGDDPLQVWYEYIKWIQQNYPTGGTETGLQMLLENCVATFKDVQKYKDDERFVDVWLNLNYFQEEPLEIFNFMMNKGIGTNIAAFYVAWADELESLKNFKKADSIYKLGMSKMAYPISHLRANFLEFQHRALKFQSDDDVVVSTESHRQSLVQIKGQGKHCVATTERQALGVVKMAKVPLSVSNQQKFTIFSDGAAGNNVDYQAKSDWQSVPKHENLHAENIINPAKWTKSKVPCKRSSAVPISHLSTLQNPSFSVHVDEHVPVTPVGKSLNIGVLSERKLEKSAAPHDLVNRIVDSPGKKAMYHKAKVYGGVVELSFEEIRAKQFLIQKKSNEELRNMKLQLEQQKASTNQQIERMHELYQKMFLEQQEQLKILQQQLERKVVPAPCNPSPTGDTAMSRVFGQVEQVATSSQIRVSATMAAANVHIQPSTARSLALAQQRLVDSSRKSNAISPSLSIVPEDELSHVDFSPNLLPNVHADTPPDTQLTTQPNPVTLATSISSSCGIGEDCYTPNKSGGQNSSSGGRTPGSLTINSKEAMHVIQGLFNHTLKADDLGFGIDEEDPDILEASRFALASDKDSKRKRAPLTAFEIFTDPIVTENVFPTPPFEICSDPSRTELSNRQPSTYADNRNIKSTDDLDGMLPIDEDLTFAPRAESTKRFPTFGIGLDEDMTFNPDFASTKIFAPTFGGGPDSMTFYDETRKPELSAATPPVSTPAGTTQNFARGVTANLSSIAEGSNEKSGSSGANDNSNHFCGHTIAPSQLDVNKTSQSNYAQQNDLDIVCAPQNDLDIVCAQQNDIDNVDMYKFIGLDIEPLGTSWAHPEEHREAVPKENFITHEADVKTEVGFKAPFEAAKLSSESCIKPPESSFRRLDSSFTSLRSSSSSRPDDTSRTLEASGFTASFRANASLVLDDQKHVIDTTHYTPINDDDVLSQTIPIDPGLNPFDDDLIESLLSGLDIPLSSYNGYMAVNDALPNFPDKGVDAIVLGDETYLIEAKIGTGAFAQVFLASKLDNEDFNDVSGSDDKRAIKVQKPVCPWEFYIISTVQRRLEECSGIDVRASVMSLDKALFYTDGSCLINQYHSNGSLLNLVNKYKAASDRLPEVFVAYIVVELLHIVEQLMNCDIIHGDIKPDNILFLGPPLLQPGARSLAEIMQHKTQSIKLVDFGRGIDLRLFSPGVCFTAKVDTSGFQCIEMKTEQPWTYQTDLFGVVGTVHVMIFNQYMNVYSRNGRWRSNSKIPRRWNNELWTGLFDTLLNIPSCDDIPHIPEVRRPFEEFLMSKLEQKRSSVNLLQWSSNH